MKLTTITSYWNRPNVLATWLKAVEGATRDWVHHIVFFVGERPPTWALNTPHVTAVDIQKPEPNLSIGYFHNVGAGMAETEWIMKLDIDTIPHQEFFDHLLPVLDGARRREWFNVGMLYVSRETSEGLLQPKAMPLSSMVYRAIMSDRKTHSASSYILPAGTNFVCRREQYLSLGGCDERFRGYGWEDYQQIYMLESHRIGADPLPGTLTMANVTHRCRDELSRLKARQLWERDFHLCLLHKWHPASNDPVYKNRSVIDNNRRILYEYINRKRYELQHIKQQR